MLGSFKIARLFGIDVRIHWSFFLVFLLPFGGNALLGAFAILVLFSVVLLHELGHSLVAKHYGVRVVDITFWPLGGMARMSEIPEQPRIEGLIAVAGPAVNFVLAALTVPLVVLAAAAGGGPVAEFLGWFLAINLLLGTFNLLPCFPMDGGRILRAFLARKRDYVTATAMAVRTGRAVVVVLLLGAFALSPFLGVSFCPLLLIAGFVWYAGGRELLAVKLRHGWNPFSAMGVRMAPTAPGAGGPFEGGGQRGPDEQADPPYFGPPGPGPRPTAADRRGFSEDEIRELERYRGRLRRPLEDDESLS